MRRICTLILLSVSGNVFCSDKEFSEIFFAFDFDKTLQYCRENNLLEFESFTQIVSNAGANYQKDSIILAKYFKQKKERSIEDKLIQASFLVYNRLDVERSFILLKELISEATSSKKELYQKLGLHVLMELYNQELVDSSDDYLNFINTFRTLSKTNNELAWYHINHLRYLTKLRELPSAEVYKNSFKSAEQFFNEFITSHSLKSFINFEKGIYYDYLGDYENSELAYKTVLDNSPNVPFFQHLKFGSYIKMSAIQANRGNYTQAGKLLSQANEIDIADSLLKEFLLSRFTAVYYYEKIGQYDSAYQFLYLSNTNEVFLDHRKNKIKIAELNVKLESSEKEKELLRQDDLILRQQNQMILLYSGIGFVGLIGLISFIYNEQRKKRIREENERQIEDLLKKQELKTAYALLEGQDKERNRIAKELHDNISSTLVTLKMFVESFDTEQLTKDQSGMMDRIADITAKAGEDTRKLSHSLDSGSLRHFGLSVALSDLVEAVNRTGSCQVIYENHLSSKITGEIAHNLYRVVQELINNTLKHARAKEIRLEITGIDDNINIIYEDNGSGFNIKEVKKGMGLKNILSRIDSLDGQITFDNNPGKNMTAIIEIPLI
ncbi:MAG: sensor histidine kinase [Cyclobacteriaceae bacterium]